MTTPSPKTKTVTLTQFTPEQISRRDALGREALRLTMKNDGSVYCVMRDSNESDFYIVKQTETASGWLVERLAEARS